MSKTENDCELGLFKFLEARTILYNNMIWELTQNPWRPLLEYIVFTFVIKPSDQTNKHKTNLIESLNVKMYSP